MHLSTIYYNPIIFNKLTGVGLNDFYNLYNKLESTINSMDSAQIKKKYFKRSRLNEKNGFLALLIYYNADVSQEEVGKLFGISRTGIYRLNKIMGPSLERLLATKANKILTKNEFFEILSQFENKDKRSRCNYKSNKFKLFLIKINKLLKVIKLYRKKY